MAARSEARTDIWEGQDARRPKAEHGTGWAAKTWLFEPESFAPLAKLVNGEQFGIVTDHLGTPSAMFDALGREVWGADIDAYGDLRNVRGERQACPFRWPGQYEDEETGLYYNRFRYYDSSAGEYGSQDPIGLFVGRRFYSGIGDPLLWFDPLGLAPNVAGMGDHQLFEHIHEVLYRDKRAGGGPSGGRHGLIHRLREQITGSMRPGSPGWATHQAEIEIAQKHLRDALIEWEKRGLPLVDRADNSLFGQNVWELASGAPPTGKETKVPKACT
jgi:RHS repeat-associated protein